MQGKLQRQLSIFQIEMAGCEVSLVGDPGLVCQYQFHMIIKGQGDETIQRISGKVTDMKLALIGVECFTTTSRITSS